MSSGIVKKFPAVPAKVYSGVEIKEFETAIELGAGRSVTWQSAQGEVTAKIAHDYNGMKDKLHYVLPGNAKMDVPEFLEKIKSSGVAYEIKNPLTTADYQFI